MFLGSKIWQFYFIRHTIHSKEKVERSLKINFKILVVISILGSPLSSKKYFSLSVWCCVAKTKILDRFLQNLQKTKEIKDLGYYKCRIWLHCVNKPLFWPKMQKSRLFSIKFSLMILMKFKSELASPLGYPQNYL